jgi:Uncharacterized ACR, COG1993
MMQKMLCLTIRIKKNDQFRGKRLEKALMDFLMGAKISGATVWTGVDGFGKRRRSTVHLEGITINMPKKLKCTSCGRQNSVSVVPGWQVFEEEHYDIFLEQQKDYGV